MDSSKPINQAPLTVTELTARIKQTLEQGFAHLEVKGEVSRLTKPSSGHLYFTIKDKHASISAVVWRSAALRLKTLPKEGQEFIFNGHLSLYEPRGTYQIIITQISPVGAGQLAVEFERRKALFAEYGWFANEKKKPIPALPLHIGIVTSLTAAAFEDVKKVLATRPAWLKKTLSPAIVQGAQAPQSIANAIQALQQLSDMPDVILLVRGGGSMEDLWCFNDEIVIKAIATSVLPIVSGVGHEIDTTLADFAADLRAATPSNAAELCCASRQNLRQSIVQPQRLQYNLTSILGRLQQKLHIQQQSLKHHQQRNLDQAMQQSAMLQQRLISSFQSLLGQCQQHVRKQHNELITLEPGRQLRQKQQQLHHLQERLATCRMKIIPEKNHAFEMRRQKLMQHWQSSLQALRHRLQLYCETLHALDPTHVLQRGYSLNYDASGKLITHAKSMQKGDTMHVHFQDGNVETDVKNIQLHPKSE
ncbi:MAG: exodeoxyribonuclease VII large subunit [Proteobacteria bacterium]|nr:MAG: exodeoxyribonuclease VII large subunit [Pseudomonadota bacterium]